MMQADSVWLATAETRSADVALITRFREQVLIRAADAIPNVVSLERYIAFNIPRTTIVATLDKPASPSPAILPHPEISCTTLRAEVCSRFIQAGERDPIADAAILYAVLFDIPEEWQPEFDAWYDQEHIPMILTCRAWAMTTRYHVQEGAWTHLALHYIKSASAFDDRALKDARLTPWRKKFLEHRWFTDVNKMIYFKQARPDA